MVPFRPMHVCSASACALAWSAKTGPVSSVGKKPGAKALHSTPRVDHASAMARVICSIPPFDAP